MSRATVFRKTLKQKGVLMPVVYDALTAKIAQQEGFSCIGIGGFAIAGAQYGAPDFGQIGLTDILPFAQKIIQAVKIPVFVDADTGYGNENAVKKTVAAYEKLAAAGLFIEDQKWPKSCGHMSQKKELITTKEMCLKIKAAISAKKDHDFIICARTDARQVEGSLEAALHRAKSYIKAGAEMIFIEAPPTISELKIIGQTVSEVPLLVNMLEGGKTPILSQKDLAGLGFTLIAHPVSVLFSNFVASRNILRHLKTKGTSKGFLPMVDLEAYKNFIIS
jgi:methylisocitrate lyase